MFRLSMNYWEEITITATGMEAIMTDKEAYITRALIFGKV